MARRMDGKVAMVTGASAGIGRAVVREMFGRGGRVAMVARRSDRLAELEAELGSAVMAVPADVVDQSSLGDAVAAVAARWGRLDIVLANAGFGVGHRIDRLTVEDFQRQFETNVWGVLRTYYASSEALQASRGVFALTGSVAGYISTPGSVAYAMSKFSVRALADGLRAEIAATGIDVVLLSPGFVASEIRQVDRHGTHRPDYRDPLPRWLVMPTPTAAKAVVDAIVRRRREKVITAHGKVLVFMARHLPRTTAFIMRRVAAQRKE